MALFKILSNMDDPSSTLPNTYHQGYCYFDVNTGYFWIDTNDTPGHQERIALNAFSAMNFKKPIANNAHLSAPIGSSFVNDVTTGTTPGTIDVYKATYDSTTDTYNWDTKTTISLTNNAYWANLSISTSPAYNTTPEMATLKLNGNTSATAASTSNVTLVFDATAQALNFVFA